MLVFKRRLMCEGVYCFRSLNLGFKARLIVLLGSC